MDVKELVRRIVQMIVQALVLRLAQEAANQHVQVTVETIVKELVIQPVPSNVATIAQGNAPMLAQTFVVEVVEVAVLTAVKPLALVIARMDV